MHPMLRLILTAFVLSCVNPLPELSAQPLGPFYSPTNSSEFSTNGAAVFLLHTYAQTNILPSPWANSPVPPPTLAPDIRERLLARRTQTVAQVVFFTNRDFVRFRAESLIHQVWTNLLDHTNGRSPVIWSERTLPLGWPLRAPIVKWNPKGLMWGMQGLTALSPCWEYQGGVGQTPITALSRRHGYARGHMMGPDGFRKQFAGMRVWFLATNNSLVQVNVAREVVRTMPVSGRDYTILLFNQDLPASIQPIRVCSWQDLSSHYAFFDKVPAPIFRTEQGGNVDAGLPGFTFDINKGGDSGSPNMLPLPGELVFCNGRTTSSPSPELQADMDELCRLEGLDPAKYRLQWADLSAFPKY